MRPRRLRVKGYTAFVEEAEVDFDGLDLFAITGPTGAGKTSLLQAMTIALYGRAPKLGDDLRQLISPSVERAQFFFEFSAHSRCYRITRVMFRARPTAVALEAQGDDGEWQTLTRGVREANARVEQILGLDFDSFTKVVLLPQNEFDAFLRGKPEERRSILTRLLSLEIYGRIQQRANQVASEARTQAEVLTGLLERDYADATPEHLDEVKEAGVAALGTVETVSARLEAIERAVAVASGVRQRRLAHRAASGDLAAHERTLAAAREEHETSAGALARVDRDVRIIADRLAAIAYDADRHLLLAGAAERTTRLREVVAALVRLDGDDAAGRAQVEELAHKRGVLGQAAAKAERALALSEETERGARSDLQEQQRRFGTRATIAGLVERERRYRVDREQEKDIERAVQTLVAHEAELATTRAGLTVRHETEQAHLEEARSAAAEQQRIFEAYRAMQGQATALGDRLTSARDRAARAHAATEQARAEAARRRHILADVRRGMPGRAGERPRGRGQSGPSGARACCPCPPRHPRGRTAVSGLRDESAEGTGDRARRRPGARPPSAGRGPAAAHRRPGKRAARHRGRRRRGIGSARLDRRIGRGSARSWTVSPPSSAPRYRRTFTRTSTGRRSSRSEWTPRPQAGRLPIGRSRQRNTE